MSRTNRVGPVERMARGGTGGLPRRRRRGHRRSSRAASGSGVGIGVVGGVGGVLGRAAVGAAAAPAIRAPVTSRNTSSSDGRRNESWVTRTCAISLRATAIPGTAAGPSETTAVSSSPAVRTLSTSGSASSAVRAAATSPSICATTTSRPIVRLRSSGVPSATIRPLAMIPTRSASSSASSRYCVVRKTVSPCSRLRRRTSSQICRRLTGSRPVVGSSRNRTSGSCTRASARSRRRRMPPE